MNPPQRKSMNDVIVPQNDIMRRPSIVPEPHQIPVREESGSRIEKNPFFEKQAPKKSPVMPSPEHPERSNTRFYLWALVALAVAGAAIVVANYFSRAVVSIVPVSQGLPLDREFTATKEGDGLVFQFMTLSEEKSKEVDATIQKTIQKKASGKVVIYNAYSGASQRLIKNTRLESPDHKIFRIDDSVVVPGAKMAGGKVLEPGSIEAVVYADVSGKDYNIGLADFTIPGFKGDPRYSRFTAKSKPDSPIGGGFSGTVKVPSDEAVAKAQTELKDELKDTVVEKARAQVPAGVSFFPGSVVLKFEEVPQELSADDATNVAMRATVSVFFFDTVTLTQKLAEELPGYRGAPMTISNMPALAFAFLDPVDNVVLADLDRIRFKIFGDATFVGKVDERKILADLAGKDKSEFATIITTEPNVKKADLVIRPFWQTKFPTDPAKISVKISSEE